MTPDTKSSQPVRWPVFFALLTAVVGIALSLFLHSRIAQSEEAAAQLTAEALQTHTERELARFVEVLESVRALITLSGAINQEAMDEFIQKGMIHQQTVLGAFGLTQRIDHPLRLAIESKPKPGPGAYSIVQSGPDSTWIPAETRTLYYPLTWQSRTGGLNVPVGFDFLSTQAARKTVGQMEHLRQTVLVSEPLPERFGKGYWVFAPVIPRNNPRSVIGCAVAILQPEAILKKVAALSAPSPRLTLTPTDTAPKGSIHFTNQAWIIRRPIRAISTDWLFECSLPVTATERRSTIALFFGLTVTALMTGLLLMLAGRTRRIEAEVQMRTEELRIANQQLEQNIRERVQLEEEMNELSAREQRRIGRDLHDSLGQKLTGAVFLSRALLNWFQKTEIKNQESEGSILETSNSQLSTDNSDPRTLNSALTTQITHAKTLNDTLKSTVAQVRQMARGLASVTLNDESLKESLHQLAEEMSTLYNIPCELKQSGQLSSLDRKTKEQLYFIAREAVNNAARHARASQITVELTGDQSDWELRVKDNGGGLPENTTGGDGMGLRIMRHRASRIKAHFKIDSTPGKGTCIEVTSNA